MAGPWEQYQSADTGPWSQFATTPQAAPDPIRAQVSQEISDQRAQGVPVDAPYGLTRRVAQGMTFGAGDEIMAGLNTPLEMIARGTLNPAEAYHYAKAREDILMEKARQDQGALGTAAEIGGGVGSGIGLARSGVTATNLLSKTPGIAGKFLARPAIMGAEGAAYGGTSGFLDGGNSLDERLSGAGKGALIGGAVGAAIPLAGAVAGTVAAPIISNIRARINPQGVATSQIARAADETGMPVSDIVDKVRQAAAEGQPEYTIADAMGFPGQRLLRTAVSANGPGRNDAVNFLEQRQAGQGRRVANTLAEGFNSPITAEQATNALESTRTADAARNYGAARAGSTPVDVSPAIKIADNYLTPGINRIVNPGTNIADNSIEAAVRSARAQLTDGRSNISDFNQAFNAKREIDHLIETGSKAQQSVLIPMRNALDRQLSSASPTYARARDIFKQQSKNIEAVDAGKTAAMRGRTEDTIPAFRALPASGKSAFRTGYVDPLIAQVQGAASGANKARPLTSDAFRQEAAAMMPMRTGVFAARRLDREQQMFQTRAEATGGSKTDMNLSDQRSQEIDPSLIHDIIGGNVLGLGRRLLGSVTNSLTGYTPAVREQVAKMLLQRGTNPTVEAQIALALAKLNKSRAVINASGSGLLAGSSIGQRSK